MKLTIKWNWKPSEVSMKRKAMKIWNDWLSERENLKWRKSTRGERNWHDKWEKAVWPVGQKPLWNNCWRMRGWNHEMCNDWWRKAMREREMLKEKWRRRESESKWKKCERKWKAKKISMKANGNSRAESLKSNDWPDNEMKRKLMKRNWKDEEMKKLKKKVSKSVVKMKLRKWNRVMKIWKYEIVPEEENYEMKRNTVSIWNRND